MMKGSLKNIALREGYAVDPAVGLLFTRSNDFMLGDQVGIQIQLFCSSKFLVCSFRFAM